MRILKITNLVVVLFAVTLLPIQVSALSKKAKKAEVAKTETDRAYWVNQAWKLAEPVLSNMSKGELQKNMQVELSPNWDGRN